MCRVHAILLHAAKAAGPGAKDVQSAQPSGQPGGGPHPQDPPRSCPSPRMHSCNGRTSTAIVHGLKGRSRQHGWGAGACRSELGPTGACWQHTDCMVPVSACACATHLLARCSCNAQHGAN